MNDLNEYNFLCHYGILGMKWGVRRYQNPDGSLTSAGRARYSKEAYNVASKIYGKKSSDYDSHSKKTDVYKNYLRKSKLAEEIGKSEDVQKQAKRWSENRNQLKAIAPKEADYKRAADNAEKEARDIFKKKYGRSADENAREDRKVLDQIWAEYRLIDKHEGRLESKEMKKLNREFDRIYDEYMGAMYKEIDKNVGNIGKNRVNGYLSSNWTYRDVLAYNLRDIYLEKYK